MVPDVAESLIKEKLHHKLSLLLNPWEPQTLFCLDGRIPYFLLVLIHGRQDGYAVVVERGGM